MSDNKKAKAIFTDLQGNATEIDFDPSKTPEEHIRVAVGANPDFLRNLFRNPDNRQAFVNGDVGLDSDASAVSLVRNAETIKTFNLTVPFSEQMDKDLKLTEDVPEFLVSAKMVVG